VKHWNILCDFDGTISTEDVIDGLLTRFGRPGWQELEDNWVAGLIGSRECMQGQVALLDVSREELDTHLDTLQIDPAFPAFVAAARALGHRVSVVSDGLDYAIHRILSRYGLDDLPVAANRWNATDDSRRWRLDSPFSVPGCASGTCKCTCVESASPASTTPVLLIGDGRSDFCASGAANFVFAKGKLAAYCREQDLPHHAIVGFADALDLLNRLALPVAA
jgi:2,3-diketo-5-methylthio-1-phosphopentane phosphatase